MGKKVVLFLAAALAVMAMLPAMAFGVLTNEYGMSFAGQDTCLGCHTADKGATVHGRFAKQGLVPAAPASWTVFRSAGDPPEIPGTGTALWNGGGSYSIAGQPWITLGDFEGGAATEYIFWKGSSDPLVNPWNLVEGLTAEPSGEWVVGESEAGLYDVTYSCQRCHMLGVTWPNTAAGEAVPNPAATIAASTTTAKQWARDASKTAADFDADPTVSYAGMSIQCERCHGTGLPGGAGVGHMGTGVQISTRLNADSLKILGQSQVCGQCHGSFTNVAGTLGVYGYTPNLPLRDFVDINGLSGGVAYTYIPTEAEFLATPTKYFMFPNGDNAKGGHFYYDEWAASAHSWRQALAKTDADALSYQADPNTSSHYTVAATAQQRLDMGCYKCHTGEGYLKSKGAAIASRFTPAADNVGFMGQECVTCHNAHPSGVGAADVIREPDLAGQRSATGLSVDNASICEDCHNWQMEIMGTSPAYKPLASITAHLVSHPQREMRHARSVMIDVPDGTEFMPNAKCEDCHMPKSNRSANRFAHGMKPMLPGNAKTWNDAAIAAGGSYQGEDSCSKCHAGETRDELQANIDAWQGATQALADKAENAIVAVTGAASPPAEYSLTDSTKPGYVLIGHATWNFKSWEADASNGVHNPEYIQAGLVKAEQMAKSVGGSFAQLMAPSSVLGGGTVFISGTVVNGNGSGADGASLKLYADGLPTSAATTADDSGSFTFMVVPSKPSTVYSVVWIRSSDTITNLSSANVTIKATSKTTLKASAKTILLGKSVKLTGTVSPADPGKSVKLQYRRSTSKPWKALATSTLSLTSTFSKTYKPAARGSWYFRAVYGGSAAVLGSNSPTVRVVVK